MAKNEIVETKSNLPALVDDFEADAGTGFEAADSNAYAIPFLQVLQSGSPQVKRSEGAYIPGAIEGNVINTVTSKVQDVSTTPLRVVPVYYTQSFVEWKTREAGGGFVAEHPASTPLAQQTRKDDKNRDILPNGNQLVDTRKHYVLVIGEDGIPVPALITMASTQLKRSRKWMTTLANLKLPRKNGAGYFQAPMYSHTFLLTTEPESNDKGSWWSWKVTLEGVVQDAGLVAAAKDFHTQIKGGLVKEANPPGEDVHPAETDVAF